MYNELAENISARIQDGDVIGIGTGKTVSAAINRISEKIKNNGFKLFGVPSSFESALQCEKCGITVLNPSYSGRINWSFDGADAVDARLRAIKGKGGALLKEKILAVRSPHYIIICDESKFTDNIAEKSFVPIEFVPEALPFVESALSSFSPKDIVLRSGSGKHGPTITEKGNLIFDVTFSEISDDLDYKLKSITGVVETGLFLRQATEVLIACASELKVLTRQL